MATELFDMVDMDYLFTAVTADRAEDYIGKEVYVANSIKDLEFQMKQCITYVLDSVSITSYEHRFNVYDDNGVTHAYALCAPSDKVKQQHKEKKYRPFKNVMEFELYTGFAVGAKLTVRGKNWNDSDGMHLMYVGNGMHDGVETLGLGNMCMPIADWFDYEYLWQEDNLEEWRPFGVAEDER